MLSISGMDRAEVLARLFNKAKPLGLGFLHYRNRNMGLDEARSLLTKYSYFDYLEGRVMKVSIPPNAKEIDERLYDRDNGQGAALDALNRPWEGV